MDEGSRGQFLNIDRMLINIKVRKRSRFFSFVNTGLGAPCSNKRVILPSELKIPFGFLIVEGAGGDKKNFSF